MAKVKTPNPPMAEPALPDIGADPDVAAARAKRDELRADLTRVRSKLAMLGDAAAGPTPDPVEVEARKLAGDPSADAAGERIANAAIAADLRRREQVLERAVAIAGETCDTAERRTAARLSPAAIDAGFAPAVRAAALAYLDAVGEAEKVRRAFGRLSAAGFTHGLSNPLARPHLPFAVVGGSGLAEIVGDLIARGAVTRDEAADRVPGLIDIGGLPN